MIVGAPSNADMATNADTPWLSRAARRLSSCAQALDFEQHGLNRGRLDTELWKAGVIGGRNIVVLHQCDLIAR